MKIVALCSILLLFVAGCTGSTSPVILTSCGIVSGCEVEAGFRTMEACQAMASSQNVKTYRTWVCEERIK